MSPLHGRRVGCVRVAQHLGGDEQLITQAEELSTQEDLNAKRAAAAQRVMRYAGGERIATGLACALSPDGALPTRLTLRDVTFRLEFNLYFC